MVEFLSTLCKTAKNGCYLLGLNLLSAKIVDDTYIWKELGKMLAWNSGQSFSPKIHLCFPL